MKAPDKIYLCADAPRIYDWSRVPFDIGGNIEYIRKDALLEWAKKKKKQLLEQELTNDEPSNVAIGINAGLDMIIGKLNSI